MSSTLPTASIRLRQWEPDDLDAYAAMNADAEVMRYFPSPLTRAQSAESMERQRQLIAERGWGLWVVDVDGVFAGFTGLAVPTFAASFMPCVEVGWRLRREFWGRSIAFRAARQALDYGFGTLKLPEILTFTAAVNAPSRRLMERLQFARDGAGDFEHPRLEAGHVLRPHVLYRMSRERWSSLAAAPTA